MILADLKLRPEAEELVASFPPQADKPFALFQPTDVVDWTQISALWEVALAKFPQVDLVLNGAGVYEPPSSTFWNSPGIAPLSQDEPDQKRGVYNTFAVNTMGPIRLAQIAIDYWLEHREVQGNLLWIASLGSYVHSMHSPFYFASKAAVSKSFIAAPTAEIRVLTSNFLLSVSMVKSLGGMKKSFGIRNAAICPSAVDVSSPVPLLPHHSTTANNNILQRHPSSTQTGAGIASGLRTSK